MNRSRRTAIATALLGACLAASAAASAATVRPASTLPLRTIARVPLSGPPVRFDYTSIDPEAGLLWVAHMNASQLLAVSLKTRRIVHTIAAPRVHGVIAEPSLDRVYASATDSHAVLTIDGRTGKVLASAPAGDYPDGLVYDPAEKHVFVSDEHGGVETVIPAAGRRIATIGLGGEAGNVQYDAGTGFVLADVQSRNDIAVIDPNTDKVIRRIPLSHCSSDRGLLVDATHRVAFVACGGSATLLTLNLDTEKITEIGRAHV